MGVLDGKPFAPGDDWPAAAWWNRLKREVMARANLRTGAGLESESGPSGWTVRRARSDAFPAILSGAANPYSYTEAQADSAGTWIPLAGGRAGSDAYEVNNIAGLRGVAAFLRPSAAGDMRFQDLRTGGGTCTVSVEVNGHCLKGVAGAVITATKGAGTWTATTNAWGYAALTLTGGAGDYDFQCVSSIVNYTQTVHINCVGHEYVTFNAPPWPTTFPASDGFGSFTLTGVGSPAGYAYTATRSLPFAAILQNCDPYTFDACHPTYAAGNFCVNYSFGCNNPTGERSGPLVMAMGVSWVGTAFNQFVPFAGGFGGIPGICVLISDDPPACCWSGGSGAVPLTVVAAGCGPSAGPTTTSCKNVTRIDGDSGADTNSPIWTFTFAPGAGINGPITVG